MGRMFPKFAIVRRFRGPPGAEGRQVKRKDAPDAALAAGRWGHEADGSKSMAAKPDAEHRTEARL